MYRNKKHNYPLYEVRPLSSLRELVDGAAADFGDRPYVKYKKNGEVVEVSYKRFKQLVDSYGTQLCRLGISSGHIAIIGDNCYEWLLSYVTALNCDGVVVPIDKELPAADIAYILNTGDVDTVIYTGSMLQKLTEAAKSASDVKNFICMTAPKEGIPEGHLSMNDLIESGAALLGQGDTSYTSITRDVDSLKQLLFTSGTTGLAKGVMLSERNTVDNMRLAQQLMLITERCLSVLPYHHSYESTHGLLTMMHHGMTVCINESLRTFLPNLKLYKPTEMLVVPLFIENIYRRVWAQAEDSGKAGALRTLIKISNALLKCGIDLRKQLFASVTKNFGGELKCIISGGAPMKAETANFFESIGIVIINGYGITECAPIVSVNRNEYHDNDSVGVPLPGSEIRIDSPNENGEGEICVKSSSVMLGYYKNPEATAEALRDGWFHTGDMGKYDAERELLYVTGRLKNLIVLNNGKNIYPEEIEALLSDCLLIADVVVCAQRDEDDSETALCAVVYPDQDKLKELGQEELEKQVRAFVTELNGKLPAYKLIKQVKFLDHEFEKTTTRKIKRKASY